MRDVALITATIEKARIAQVRRLETCPGFNESTRQIVIREVNAAVANIEQAVMLLAEPERPTYANH